MKTLTVEEAVSSLPKWLELALAGEDIRIQKGNALVELRPVKPQNGRDSTKALSPRAALRELQKNARLTSTEARNYLEELLDERRAAESRRPT